MKFLFSIVKRFIMSMFLLYGFNLISTNFNLTIPINIYSTFIVLFLGCPGLILLVLFNFLIL